MGTKGKCVEVICRIKHCSSLPKPDSNTEASCRARSCVLSHRCGLFQKSGGPPFRDCPSLWVSSGGEGTPVLRSDCCRAKKAAPANHIVSLGPKSAPLGLGASRHSLEPLPPALPRVPQQHVQLPVLSEPPLKGPFATQPSQGQPQDGLQTHRNSNYTPFPGQLGCCRGEPLSCHRKASKSPQR